MDLVPDSVFKAGVIPLLDVKRPKLIAISTPADGTRYYWVLKEAENGKMVFVKATP